MRLFFTMMLTVTLLAGLTACEVKVELDDGVADTSTSPTPDTSTSADTSASADTTTTEDAGPVEPMECDPACADDDVCVDGACVTPEVCTPTCDASGAICGDDGCGGSCGDCIGQEYCEDGMCMCAPSCFGKECGDDGCGGTCGTCDGGPMFWVAVLAKGEVWSFEQEIMAEGDDNTVEITTFTIEDCTPNCGDAMCGDDGCGGSCGSCGDSEQCVSGICAGVGDVSVTLQWDTDHDLDLHVIDPAGEELNYDHTTSASGGTLDIDAHAGCNGLEAPGVENVYWPTGGAPDGTYQVFVTNYDDCSASASTFTVTINAYGVEESFTYDMGDVGAKDYVVEFDLTQCVPDCGGSECGDDGCGGSCGACGMGETCQGGLCAGTGDVAVTLQWDTEHDLDIFVTDPNGFRLYYGAKTSDSGGELDIDSHADCEETDSLGVENVYWPAGTAPAGMYTVEVNNYSICDYVDAPMTCNDWYECQ